MRPCQRLLASPDLGDDDKAELRRRYRSYNPVLLQQEVHGAVQALMDVNQQKDLMRRRTGNGPACPSDARIGSSSWEGA
ncbi:MAG: hypothetical protein LBE17_13640 [Treponema sp.]|nr:hypothetical protein [Treponema sp.]